jgi:uncharacterized repeat protein (TIGR01451 family)
MLRVEFTETDVSKLMKSRIIKIAQYAASAALFGSAALLGAGPASASPFTTTVPGTADQIPGNYPEAGGIVLVLLGDNGNYYFQISNPSEMMRGFQDRNSTTPQAFRGSPTWQLAPSYNMQCGLVTCTEYFGGGVQQGWVRFTAFDGDTSSTATTGNNFDIDDITLNLNGSTIGNWTDPVTQETNTSGTTVLSNGTGFADGNFDTGWFDITDPALLNDLMVNGNVTWTATDDDPNDNFWDFTRGNDADTSTVPERVAPGMTVTKTPRDASYSVVGDTVTYDYFIRNVGTVYIDLITVSDDQIGNVTCPQTRLNPGEDMTCTAIDTITQDDIDNGSLINNVTVTGTPQAGSLGPVGATATVPATAQTSSMTVAKSTTSAGPYALGDVINYSVVMTNTGTVSQTGVTVTDPLLTPTSATCARVLPSDTCELVGTYSVTQADVDAGSISNTGGATSDQTPIAVEDTISTDVEQASGLSVAKTALDTSYAMAGDTIDYEYVVSNTGTVTITDPISVSDDKIASVSCPALPAGGLAPSATLTCTATYTVVQADLNSGSVTNNATATDGATTSAPATETVNASQMRALGISKTADVSSFSAPGDIISYEYIVSNIGNVTITDPISVSDDKIASVTCPALPAGGLAPMQALVCTASYSATQVDIDAGSVTNIASATDGTTVSADATETVNADQAPAMTVVKTSLAADFDSVGDTIDYEYVVTNSGNTTITAPVSISDDKIASVICPALPAGGLAPMATLTCTAQYVVTQADLDAGAVTNLATATDGTTTSPEVSETVSADQTPEMTVTKTADASALSSPAVPGDVITYTILVNNSGNVSLSNVSVTDPQIGGDVTGSCVFPATAGELAAGDMATCTVAYAITQDDIDAGSVQNSAVAAGQDPTGGAVSDTSDAGDEASETPDANGNTDGDTTNDPTVTAINQVRDFTVDKTAMSFAFEQPGDTAMYGYVVTNTGNVTLTDAIVINDNLIAPSDISCPALPAGGIAPGATYTCNATYTVTQADLDNGSVTNVASATDGTFDSPVDSATIPADQSPSMEIVKTSPDTSFASVGDILNYDFTIRNTGNLTLTGATEVVDDRIGTFTCFTGNIVPGDTVSCSRPYTVTLADMDAGFVTNQAYGQNGTLVSAPVDLTIDADQSPSLTLVKDALNGSFDTQGDIISYTYTVTNTGNVTISGVSVSDDLIAVVACPDTVLAPSEQTVCTADYTVTQADVDAGSVTNNASVTGTPAGGTLADVATSETVDADQMPVLSFEKIAQDTTFAAVGDTLTYQYVVRNEGNVTISSIAVTDDRISPVTCPQTVLNAGAQMVCTASDTVTQADIDAGFVTNNASVSGTPAGGTLDPVSDSQTVSATQTPGLTTDKRALQADFAAAGDVLTYAYDVTNTGNTTLTAAITITDDKIPSVTCPALPAGGLVPGASLTCTASYTVSQADVDAGSVTNMAIASSGSVVAPPASETVDAIQTASLSTTKTARTTTVAVAGETVIYDYVVTNDGNVTITSQISVSDDKIASVSCPALPVGGLAPDASLSCMAQYIITQADIDAGGVTNQAAATDGTIVSPVVSETVTATQTPALTVNKTAQTTVYDAVGDVINYTYDVQNSGNTTITTAISVSDDRIPSVTCPALPAGGLTPGGVMTCSASYTITQADIDAGSVTNIASASDGTTTSPDVSETVTADRMPSLTVDKTPVVVNFDVPGDTAEYDYVVTNTGNTTIVAPISVSDNRIATVNCPALPAGGLLPGDDLTCTATYVVTQQDLDNGSVTNLASGTDGTTTSPIVDATIPASQNPAMQLSKVALTSSFSAPGDRVEYEFNILNQGNLTLTGSTTITDDKIGTFECFNGNIAPNTSVSCTAEYFVTQADIDAGFVTNQAFGSNADRDVTSSVVEETVDAVQNSELSITKTALDTSFAAPGDTINYEYEVSNTGNTTIVFPVTVADNRIASVSCPALPAGGLIPGGSLTCTASDTVSQADIDAGSVTNVASASDGVITSPDVSETVSATQTPSASVAKTVLTSDFAMPGDRLDYEYVVTNTGNTSLLGPLSISDDRIASISCPALPSGGLLPGGQVICTAFDTVTQSDIDAGTVANTATATLGGVTTTPVTETVGAAQSPMLTLVKTVDASNLSDPVAANDVLTYTMTVRNTGNVSLTNVTVRDNLLGGDITSTCVFPGASGSLDVGARADCSATYTITQADVDAGGVENSARADATDPAGGPVSDTSDSGNEGVETPGLDGSTDGDATNDPTVTNFGPAPALSIQKSAVDTSFAVAGDTVSYEYVVTNVGNVTLTDPITVSDDKIASVSCPAIPAGGLAPMDAITCSASYTVTQSDIDDGSVTNIATASTGAPGNVTRSPEDSVTVDAAQMPAIVFSKTVADPVHVAGSIYEATYTLRLENSGNTTLSNVQIDDDLASALSPATLFGDPVVNQSGFFGSGSVNPGYDGASSIALLTTGLNLPVGETATVTITARVDVSAGSPASANTAFVTSDEVTDPMPSNDPSVTPGTPGDTNPTPFSPTDADGDGAPDTVEDPNTDRDGDGIPDREDYDPTGYFYCQENGQILSGGSIAVSGPAGTNASIGTANNITIVQDGSLGYFQFFATQPGRYTIVPTYPQSGVPSTDRIAESAALDVTSVLPANPAVLGSSEFGATGRLADFSAAANAPYYMSFDIEPGDPAVFMNNIPMSACGVPAVGLEKSVVAEAERQDDGRVRVVYDLTATNTGETVLTDVQISDDLASVYGEDTVQVANLELMSAPSDFDKPVDATYNGQSNVTMLAEAIGSTDLGQLLPGESATVRLDILVQPNASGEYVNNAQVTATPPEALDPAQGPNAGQSVSAIDDAAVTIDAISDPNQLVVTKTARPGIVQIGDTVRYQITVENTSDSVMTDLRVVDTPPAGFAYVPGSATFSDASGARLAVEPTVAPGRMAWTLDAATAAPFDALQPGETLSLNLSMVGGANTEFGELVNRAYVEDTVTGIRSLVATAVVEYLPEPTFDCTPVIGHVYDDVNRNGYQDDGEPGLPGVRLATVNGDLIRTDQYGRFHIPCATIPDSERGSNFLLKVDARTLPLGFNMTTENPRIVRATRGKFVKMNFGAAFEGTVRMDVSSVDFNTDNSVTGIAQAHFAAQAKADRALIVYHAENDESVERIMARLSAVQAVVADTFKDVTVEAAFSMNDANTADTAFTGLANDGPRIEGKLPGQQMVDAIGEQQGSTYLRRVLALGGLPGASAQAYGATPEIEMTVDALHVQKALHANVETVSKKDGARAAAVFAWWNYPAWVERAEVRLFEDGASPRGTPVSTAPIKSGTALLTLPEDRDYRLVVRVYDAEGRFDETTPRLVAMENELADLSQEEAGERAMDSYGANSIAVSAIPVNGATVRVFGRNVGGETATALGQTVFIDADGQFVAEAILPDGAQMVEVTAGDHRILREVDVKTRDIFATGLIEATIGQRLSQRADEDDVFVDGRAAFYVRGRLDARYRITATADTGEAPLGDLFSNLDEKDVRSLLRRLDPDRYYPVYGDDSVITEDAPTSGRFYLRVERDDDYALWGNYKTGFNDTEFTRIERTLYGAKFNWDQDSNPTALGDARSEVTAFVAEPGTRSARDELRGTGGSVYYMRNADISIGSELLRVEERDVISGIVLSSRPLRYGTDYDIDYIQGRVLLTGPLGSTADDGRLFSDGGLSGNPVFLVAEYEYTADFEDSDEIAFGLRGSRWLNDYVKTGLTWTRDAQQGNTTDLVGIDVALQLTGDTYLKAEIAGSDGSGFDTFRSLDGGFDYVQAPTPTGEDDPMAWLVEGAANLADLGLSADGRLSAYYRHRDAGFAGYGQIAETDIDQYGAQLDVQATETTGLRGRIDVVEGGFGGERKLAEVSVSSERSEQLTVEAGVSYQDTRDYEDSLAVGARADYKIDDDKSVYVFGQVGVDGDGNAELTDRLGVGLKAALNSQLTLAGEISGGAGGMGAQASVRQKTDEFTETYLTYDLPTRSNTEFRGGAFGQNTGGLTVGTKRRYSDAVSIHGEERLHFGGGEGGQSGVTHAYGVDYKPEDDWTFGLQAELGQIEDFDRKALSLTGGYAGERVSAGATVEYRTDENREGGEDLEAVLLRVTTQYQANEALRLQGKLNHANTTGSGGAGGAINFNQANFTEASIAGAYRPIDNDRFNALAKIVYLSDTSPIGQRLGGNRIDYKQRSLIVSVDGTYDLTDRCSVGGKLGHRSGEVTDGRNSDDFFESGATLYVARADCHIVGKWDLMAEGRRLELSDVSGRDGALVGVFRQLGDNVRVGGGVAWGGVDDQYLSLEENREAGPFFNIIGKF